MGFSKIFTGFSNAVARATGRPITFVLAVVVIVIWAACGPVYGYSDTWQLVINTGTTIITFLMVFLIQNTQNRDGAAIQTKLDELIRASAAQNVFIGIEHLTEEEVEEMRKKCESRAKGEVVRGIAGEHADKAEEQVNRKAARAADEYAG
jgi:low affinity Fe/Cu permease